MVRMIVVMMMWGNCDAGVDCGDDDDDDDDDNCDAGVDYGGDDDDDMIMVMMMMIMIISNETPHQFACEWQQAASTKLSTEVQSNSGK